MAGFEFILSSLVELRIPNYVESFYHIQDQHISMVQLPLLLLLKSISSLLVQVTPG